MRKERAASGFHMSRHMSDCPLTTLAQLWLRCMKGRPTKNWCDNTLGHCSSEAMRFSNRSCRFYLKPMLRWMLADA